ncbi:lipoyl(octanoyl) transferase [Thermoactinomyces sp. DSM 45891]|uniref:lipoyl(octanoyl) transferase LipB n=1 Tax=Thermoactinomyces sp. DSM 45891 TaxID=1761907 RepID=UPI0009120549|nr:lipoyl(octanoyl) transferase LipB [Thermoactinomyces sp. DSM 45891]SFX04293.1 lipoyl(octanoyl) transferase [Thermoactinomyces sp. DSM 45891]
MFEIQRLGPIPYQEAWDLQKKLVHEIDHEGLPSQLLLLEHPHTLTLGRGSHTENLLFSKEQYAEMGMDLVEIDRGGDVTYHGPGQLVGYPIFDLATQGNDAHAYLRQLEEVLIIALRHFGLQPSRKAPYTGVWIGEEKVAAIGVKFNRARTRKGYITSHGFALNVNSDLQFFQTIIPCGIQEYGVTSLEKLLGREIDLAPVMDYVIEAVEEVFGWKAKDERCLSSYVVEDEEDVLSWIRKEYR